MANSRRKVRPVSVGPRLRAHRKLSRVVMEMAVPPEILDSKTSICSMPTSRPLPTVRNSQCSDSPPRSAAV
jgi:hypothetical protein